MSGLSHQYTSREFSYQFGPFLLDMSRGCLLRDAEIVPLRAKLFELLLVFVHSGGRLLSKEELMEAVWQDTHVEEETVARSVSWLNQALRNGQNGERYIETVKARGYRLVAEVIRVPASGGARAETRTIAVTLPEHAVSHIPVSDRERALGGNLWHVLAASILYGGLYGVALLLEIAYSWGEYGREASKSALFTFGWIGLSSLAGMWLDWKAGSRSPRAGLALSVAAFLVSAGLLYVVLCNFLPAVPVTLATFQTHTAQGAYLKDILYFLILAGFFVIAPFHFVVYLRREVRGGRHDLVLRTLSTTKLTIAPKATVYLVGLVALLLFFTIRSTFDHTQLLDNLLPGPHKNLFIQLVYVRLALYFGLAVECLIWYYRALNALKRDCVGLGMRLHKVRSTAG